MRGSYFYRSVMYDRRTGKSKVVVPDIWVPTQPYYTYSLAHIYEEDVPELEWEITGEHGMVASFDCQKAECDFRGRRWEAWFTTEIPVGEGPWKLRGLPGLILYARDTPTSRCLSTTMPMSRKRGLHTVSSSDTSAAVSAGRSPSKRTPPCSS